jgi:hypothetical protein
MKSKRSHLLAAEYLARKIFDHKICSPFRDGRGRENPDDRSLSAGQGVVMRDAVRRAAERLKQGRFIMRKTILTILGVALLAASTVQIAAAAEHHKARKADRTQAPVSEPIRNSNAFYGWPSPSVEPGWSRYENGAMSAPAGR